MWRSHWGVLHISKEIKTKRSEKGMRERRERVLCVTKERWKRRKMETKILHSKSLLYAQECLPLHSTLSNGKSKQVIEWLMEMNPDEVRSMTDDEYLTTPLHVACLNQASTEVIKLLIEPYPESVQSKDLYGSTPLQLSALCNLEPAIIDTTSLAAATAKVSSTCGSHKDNPRRYIHCILHAGFRARLNYR